MHYESLVGPLGMVISWDKPLEKTSFNTKVGDQICGVGYYKD
jgi:hypothetical protein